MTTASLSLTVDTPVLTIRGQIAVASLVPEDHVILQTGHTAKVSWISSEFLYENSACNEADMPILIEADAVLDGVPMRDLLVLPTQIIFLNGALLSADTLVNGLSIRRVKTSSLAYREIKLCVSGCVYAGGLPVGPCLEGHFETDDNAVVKAVQISLLKRTSGEGNYKRPVFLPQNRHLLNHRAKRSNRTSGGRVNQSESFIVSSG